MSKKYRVLIVEDTSATIDIYRKRFLNEKIFEIEEFIYAEEVIKRIESLPSADLIVLDMSIPWSEDDNVDNLQNGRKLLEKIRIKLGMDVPIIIVSAFTSKASVVDQSYWAGFGKIEYLMKPTEYKLIELSYKMLGI